MAQAELYPPSGRRTTWALVYGCPICLQVHFGRSATADADGERRSGCGKRIWLSVCETQV